MLGSLFLALPFTWSLNLITTDTPLILFLFFSGYAFLRGEQSDDLRWYAVAGLLLGLALLSKYFAGLLAITYAAYLLPRSRRSWLKLILLALCALPFMLLNMAWNAPHCWNNILFNLFNRNEGSRFSLTHLAVYLLMMIYLVTPWTGWRLLRSGIVRSQRPLVSLFAVPFAIFLLLSFYKTIGLHWVLAFLPFVFLRAGMALDVGALRAARRWNLWLGLPHLIALALLKLAAKVGYEIDPNSGFPKFRSGEVIVKMKNGEHFRQRESILPDEPASESEIVDKFMLNVEPLMDTARAEAIRDTLLSLEQLPDTRELMALLSGAK